MSEITKEIINKILDIIILLLKYLLFTLLGFFIGVIFCSIGKNNEYNPQKTHYILEHENKYQYCPYCGELLIKESEDN